MVKCNWLIECKKDESSKITLGVSEVFLWITYNILIKLQQVNSYFLFLLSNQIL